MMGSRGWASRPVISSSIGRCGRNGVERCKWTLGLGFGPRLVDPVSSLCALCVAPLGVREAAWE